MNATFVDCQEGQLATLISIEPQLGVSFVVTLPAALSDPKGPESLFFAGPKKSDPVASRPEAPQAMVQPTKYPAEARR
ncbi:hypothetical protein GCM10007901_26530 [Dyella acidisoli]|uniref:Uncharacterized protein n=1 Tax=Dyella acidisoli TaxID=1867834 RepID=A0ABQ5XQN8_9GAMM|nr:hypothetical protein GCM10007901_26530 [Dyella acidisoli]